MYVYHSGLGCLTPNNPNISALRTQQGFPYAPAMGLPQMSGSPLCSLLHSGPGLMDDLVTKVLPPLSRGKGTWKTMYWHLKLPPRTDAHHFSCHFIGESEVCEHATFKEDRDVHSLDVQKEETKSPTPMSRAHAKCHMSSSLLILDNLQK